MSRKNESNTNGKDQLREQVKRSSSYLYVKKEDNCYSYPNSLSVLSICQIIRKFLSTVSNESFWIISIIPSASQAKSSRENFTQKM